MESGEHLKNIFDLINQDKNKEASAYAGKKYPFTPIKKDERKYTNFQSSQLFIRDGFVDRFSGKKLVFPGMLRLLSKLLPDQLPYQSSWKSDECHYMYWELFPTVDHLVPIARGGKDVEENWVTTSMIRNSAKSNFLLEEIDWKLYAAGKFDDWNGLLPEFLEYYESHPELKDDRYLRTWYNAGRKASVKFLRFS